MSRDENTDNAKRGPSQTKAMRAVQMPVWPTMGAWKAPGQTVVEPSSEENEEYQAGLRGPFLNDADTEPNQNY